MVNQVRITRASGRIGQQALPRLDSIHPQTVEDGATSSAVVEAATAPAAPAVEDFPPLFLTCECGRMAAVKIDTPFNVGAYCSGHARSFLREWPWLEYARICHARGIEP